jgi:hypothetical protein
MTNVSQSTYGAPRVEPLEGRTLLSGTAVPISDELLANDHTAGAQSVGTGRSMVSAPNGNYAVIWDSSGSGLPPSQVGIFAAIYSRNADGAYAKRVVQVDGKGSNPSIAMDDGGNFVAAWVTYSGGKRLNDVYARRFAADGTPIDAQSVLVNTYTTGAQQWPSVAMDSDGDFVVTWLSQGQDPGTSRPKVAASNGVYAQRFSRTGIRVGSEFRVNTYLPGAQSMPNAAMDDAGDFVIVWVSGGDGSADFAFQDGSGGGVFGQRYDALGQPQGPEFQVNQTTQGPQTYPLVDMDAAGNFVVGWNSNLNDGSYNNVYARRYAADGAPVSGEFLVNAPNTPGNEYLGNVTIGPDGAFLLTWNQYPPGEGVNAENYGQLYSADGTAAGDRFMINQTTAGFQGYPTAAFLSPSQFVVAWDSGSSQADVYVRLFDIRMDPLLA